MGSPIPDSAIAHCAAGALAINRDLDAETAERHLRRAVERDPGLLAARQYLAEALSILEKHEEALATIEAAIRVEPLNAVFQGVRGLVLTRAIVTVAAGLVVGTLGVVAWEAAFRPAARSRDVVPGAALADPFVLLSISAVLAIVTITACLAPIRRAQRVSPAVALRCE